MSKFRKLQTTFVNGEQTFNFGGIVPGILAGGAAPVPSPTPSNTPTNTPTLTPTNTPTLTPTNTPTNTPTPSPLVLTTEYQAILTRATTLGYGVPGYYEQIKQNQLIVDLKNAGIWNKLGTFLMFKLDTAGSSVSPQFTFIDWITPNAALSSLGIARDGFIDPPTFVNNTGWELFKGNFIYIGENVQTGVNPITLTSTNNSEGLYINSVGGGTTIEPTLWSSSNNGWNAARYADTTNHIIFRNNLLTSTYDFTGLGFKSVSIDGQPNADTTLHFNNAGVEEIRTKTSVDTGIAGGVGFYLPLQGAAYQDFNWNVGMWFAGGGGLGSADMLTFEPIITNYMNS